MYYKDKRVGYSLALPKEWRHNKHELTTTFNGTNWYAGCFLEIIQIRIGTILPQYQDPTNREKFLAEPGAKVFRSKLGIETNVVVLKRANNSELSAVHDGLQYIIAHTNDKATFRAIECLQKSFKFPSIEDALISLEHSNDPQKQAIWQALNSNSVEEMRHVLSNEAMAPTINRSGYTEHHIATSINHLPTNNDSYKNLMIKYARDSIRKMDLHSVKKYEGKALYVDISDFTVLKLFLSKANIALESNSFANEYGEYLANEYGRYISKIFLIQELSNQCISIIGAHNKSSKYFIELIELKEGFITSIQEQDISIHIEVLQKLAAFYNVGTGFEYDSTIPSLDLSNPSIKIITVELLNTIKFLIININGLYIKNDSNYLGNPDQNCFIATAVYGDINKDEVIILRNYRDKKLMSSWIGKKLVRLYYSGFGEEAGKLISKKMSWSIPFIKRILDKIVAINQNR